MAETSTPNNKAQIVSEPKNPFPKQHQEKPGFEHELVPRPRYKAPRYKAAGKLEGKVAIVTGGDSGIGRAVAVLYAREGAHVCIVSLPAEHKDAEESKKAIEEEGRQCLALEGDLSQAEFCKEVIEKTIEKFGKLDILVSNAAHQVSHYDLQNLDDNDWDYTFKTNVYAYFRLLKAALPHLKEGAAVIATSSETGLMGAKRLPDYSATKGAIDAFTKTMAQQLIDKGIRVNAVAPGPVWTPLNPSDPGLDAEKIEKFGSSTPIGRPAQPEEIAPAYVYLASEADSSYVTGEILSQMGGKTTAG